SSSDPTPILPPWCGAGPPPMTSAPAATDFSLIRAGSQPEGFDPYPLYAALRASAPVWKSPWGEWYLTSSDGVSKSLLHPACSRSPFKAADATIEPGIARYFRDWVIYLDAPAHVQLRNELSRPFAGARLTEL